MSNIKTTLVSVDQKVKFLSFSKVSTQVRYLTSIGLTRSQIVTYVRTFGHNKNIRYQHVRNVQVTPITNPSEKF